MMMTMGCRFFKEAVYLYTEEAHPFMIKIALYSEDRTLHPLLSSALGREFQVLLESDQEGMNDLVSAGECDVMILDLNSNHDSLQERIE